MYIQCEPRSTFLGQLHDRDNSFVMYEHFSLGRFTLNTSHANNKNIMHKKETSLLKAKLRITPGNVRKYETNILNIA